MKHLIVTRFGIGVARPEFHNFHLKLMEIGLAQSMAKQTNQDFEWIIATDININPEAKAGLEELTAGYSNFRIIFIDPFVTGAMVPRIADIISGGPSETIIFSRIDDDDLISVNFVEDIRNAVDDSISPGLISISYLKGIELCPPRRQFSVREHQGTPVGATVVSNGPYISAYDGNHRQLHDRIAKRGGANIKISSAEAKWIYLRRPGSDSAVTGVPSVYGKQVFSVDSSGCEAELLAAALNSCGASPRYIDQYNAVVETTVDNAPPIYVSNGLNRLSIKSAILRSATSALETDLPALKAAFYAV